jgi:hypothetical protein
VPTKDDIRIFIALAAIVGLLTGVGFSLLEFTDLDPFTESIREAKIQRQIDEFRDMRRNRFSMEN